mmetsp:Transcript_21296/g.50003  ORF Transcript_21296/g.50003 Transcript_21296/m.50003 type:complete len:213 (-) Transcript_21296:889-1527(-)
MAVVEVVHPALLLQLWLLHSHVGMLMLRLMHAHARIELLLWLLHSHAGIELLWPAVGRHAKIGVEAVDAVGELVRVVRLTQSHLLHVCRGLIRAVFAMIALLLLWTHLLTRIKIALPIRVWILLHIRLVGTRELLLLVRCHLLTCILLLPHFSNRLLTSILLLVLHHLASILLLILIKIRIDELRVWLLSLRLVEAVLSRRPLLIEVVPIIR